MTNIPANSAGVGGRSPVWQLTDDQRVALALAQNNIDTRSAAVVSSGNLDPADFAPRIPDAENVHSTTRHSIARQVDITAKIRGLHEVPNQ